MIRNTVCPVVLLNRVYYNFIKTCLHVSEIKKYKKLKFMYLEVYFKKEKGVISLFHCAF